MFVLTHLRRRTERDWCQNQWVLLYRQYYRPRPQINTSSYKTTPPASCCMKEKYPGWQQMNLGSVKSRSPDRLLCNDLQGINRDIKDEIIYDVCVYTVQITFIFIDFRVCDFAFAFKTQNAPCVSHFIFRQISICVLDANETFVWLVNTFDASYIAHYRSNGYAPLHRTLSLKWIWPAVSETLVLNETKPTKRSQITDQNLRKEANAKCAVSVHAKRVSNS